jgi:DNA-binding SARP family transcriptional activator
MVVNSELQPEGGDVEFRLLGPFEVVEHGRSVPLGGSKQRALLAILAIHANELVPADRLIEHLWPDDPPESAANTLQGYVSRLRKALGSNGSNGARPVIVFRSPGYVLAVPPEQIDARRFERLLDDAEAQAGNGDSSAAARSLREALALWRGAPLADFTYERFAQLEIARLEELRLRRSRSGSTPISPAAAMPHSFPSCRRWRRSIRSASGCGHS